MTIKYCLESVRRHIHTWVIVDTGSTDGTQEEIRSLLHDIPGELFEREWVNFGHNRNEALFLALGKSDYLLHIDADEELIGSGSLPPLDLDFYTVDHKASHYTFHRHLLHTNDRNWHWDGVVHETLANQSQEALQFGHLLGFYKACPQPPLELGIQKMRLHAELLETEHQKNPGDPRTVFYLAQTHFEARNYPKAYAYYEMRAKMDGWDQEIYWALFRKALVLEHHLHGSSEAFLPLYWEAYQFRPTRIEALYHLSAFYLKHNQAARALEILQIIASTPRSDDAVLVEHWMYEWGAPFLTFLCAKSLGRKMQAKELREQLLREPNLPPKQRSFL